MDIDKIINAVQSFVQAVLPLLSFIGGAVGVWWGNRRQDQKIAAEQKAKEKIDALAASNSQLTIQDESYQKLSELYNGLLARVDKMQQDTVARELEFVKEIGRLRRNGEKLSSHVDVLSAIMQKAGMPVPEKPTLE